jgi:hypothetical protein
MTDSIWSHALASALVSVLAAAAVASSGLPTATRSTSPAEPDGSAGRLAGKVTRLLEGKATLGRDISWPNCPKGMGIASRRTEGKPLPPASSRFVVIGLTNGPAFNPNPCLAEQVEYAESLHMWTAAYAVVTYPTTGQLEEFGDQGPYDATDRAGRLRNTGYVQALENVQSMRGAGLDSPVVWLDVETVRRPAPWSADVTANRAVLEGSMRAYRAAGFQLGVYSTPYLWRAVVGPVRYRLPEWRTAGRQDRTAALARCVGPTVQGGRAVLAQWYDLEADHDTLCPGRPTRQVLARYFSPH